MTRTSREGAGETKITSHVFERDDLDEALGTPSGTGAPPKRHTMPARLIERAPVIRRTGLPRVDGRRVVAVSEPLDRSTHADELRKLLGRRRRAISSQPVMPEPNPLPALPPNGNPVDAVFLELSASRRHKLTATLLRRNRLGDYQRTNTTVTVVWPNPTAPLQMGNARDLKPGAVLEVIGRVGHGQSVIAAQLIVLTGHLNLA